MTFNRESSLHNAFYSLSNYGWDPTKCQTLNIRAVTKIKYFKIQQCLKPDTYTMKIECLMFALYFSFIWGGHPNVLVWALSNMWKKVTLRKINISGSTDIDLPSVGNCAQAPPDASRAWRSSKGPPLSVTLFYSHRSDTDQRSMSCPE